MQHLVHRRSLLLLAKPAHYCSQRRLGCREAVSELESFSAVQHLLMGFLARSSICGQRVSCAREMRRHFLAFIGGMACTVCSLSHLMKDEECLI